MGETSEKRKRNRQKQLKREEKEDRRWLKREEKARREGRLVEGDSEFPEGERGPADERKPDADGSAGQPQP